MVEQVSDAVDAIAHAVEVEGLMLVHDQQLPSATALIAGEPVQGSWWAHPDANVIYAALGELEDRFATCKLISKKLTLVAPRHWPDIAAIGLSKQKWQLAGLSPTELEFLDRVYSASTPLVPDQREEREAGRRLEERLLVTAEEVHTDTGRHVKAFMSWTVWARRRQVSEPLPAADAAMDHVERVVRGWDPAGRLLPWH